MLLHLSYQYPDIHHKDSIHPLQIMIPMTPTPVPLAVLIIPAPLPPPILMTPALALLAALMTLMILNLSLHFVFLLVVDHMLSLFNPTF